VISINESVDIERSPHDGITFIRYMSKIERLVSQII